MALSGDERASMSRLERWLIAARVLLALGVAVACALLATRILETRFLRARFDLSQDRSNTLDPLMVGVLARLEEEVVVDAYFTPSDPPFEVVGAEVQDRTRRLLRLMSDESGGLLRVELHDVARRGRPSARAEARRGELQLSAIEPGGLVVLSRGKRKELVRLRGGLADLDPGNPDPRLAPWAPARIVSFRAEESLAAALLALAPTEPGRAAKESHASYARKLAGGQHTALRPSDILILQVFVPVSKKWTSDNSATVGSRAWVIQQSIASWRQYASRHGCVNAMQCVRKCVRACTGSSED